ncbi:amidohydrolase [Herbiconiux sp. P15]|uniref:amidohydrolase family protein n=1 Tax=Herbiconiux liukaitaii TaxID=3342799 RepID=UPI0035B86DDA
MTATPATPATPAVAAGATRVIVDGHAHVWDRSRTPIPWIDASLPDIDRDFSVAELHHTATAAVTLCAARPEVARPGGPRSGASPRRAVADQVESDGVGSGRAAGGVVFGGAVLVQALNDAGETLDLLRTARGPVVGWLDLDADGVGERIDALREAPGGHRLAGIRHLAHVDPDPEWLLRPGVARGLEALAAAGLPFDLVVRPWQLPLAARVADAHPTLRLVLDHLAQPPAGPATPTATDTASGASDDEVGRWERDLRALAERPNVVAKVSGIAVRGEEASRARLAWAGGVALEAFGPGRLMFGSDWPLVRLADDYAPWLAHYLDWSAALSPDEQRALDSLTARAAYGPTTPDPLGTRGDDISTGALS